ncbi:hypothetical protein QJQ45_018839, partial [Haematococcus lacustris]
EVVVHTWVEWLKEQRHLFTVGGQPEAALADSHGAMEKEEEEGEEGGWNPEGAAAEVAFLLESVRSRIVSGLPVTERKSTFQAHVAKVDSAQEAQAMVTALLENNKIRGATHNIMTLAPTLHQAYRIPSSHVGNFHTDCDDDGETAAGGRLLHLLQVADAQRVVVVVTRWYGGVQLGPARFTLINNADARTALAAMPSVHGVPSKAQR